jgi:ABC-type transport system involved in multi-copper enzyme maturation permease subunit
MGIYDLGYRVFKGRIGGRLERIWAIFIQEFMFRIRKPWNIVILVLSYFLGLVPTIIFTYVMISFAIVTGENAPIQIYDMYFQLMFIWVIIFTSVVGAPVVSNDLKNNAIILYFSRPLKKEDYFLGKFLTIFMMVMLVTVVPALLMSVTILGLATEELTKHMDIVTVVLTLNLVAVLMAMVFASIAFVISTLSKNYFYAGIGIFSFLALSNIIALMFLGIIHENFLLLSIWQNLFIIADDGAGFNTLKDFEWYTSLLILLGIIGVSLGIAWRKISRVEVI